MKELSKRNSPPRRGMVDAPQAQTGWSARRKRPARTESQLHEELTHALRRYEELYDLAPMSFFTLDRHGNILSVNKAGASLLGFPVEWLHHRPFLVFVARTDVRRCVSLLAHLRRMPDYRETIELELSVNNHSVPVQISLKSSMTGDQIVYRMAIVDLSETKIIERELKQTLGNWYSLVESAPDVIMTVDRKGKITFASRNVWGFADRAMLGTCLTDYVSGKDRIKLQKYIERAFRSSEPQTCEVSGINGDTNRWYSFSFGPVNGLRRLARETTTTTTVSIRDVTEHRRTEESLRSSREQLREFAARLDQVREEERMRMAREIHDELGQALTILKMDLAWLQGKVRAEHQTRKKIKSMITDVDQTIEHVRRIVSELRPSILDEMGLPAALEWQVSQFQERTGIRAVFESGRQDFKLSPDIAAALFRVVQEALTNVVRHAGARHVRVALRRGNDILRIAVTDDGKGLGRAQINNKKSFGIVGMRERVHRIGGEFNIFSGPGRGTRLEIAAPIK